MQRPSGCGTVFKITPSGTLTTLWSFSGPDGAVPWAGLIQATDGNLYGTTSMGGTSGNGTVFKISPLYPYTLTTLYSFSGSDGAVPYAELIQARPPDGNFYGTTSGGTSNNGTVFKISPLYPYTLTTLHIFSGSDGAVPWAGLIQATDGNFYGTTAEGGANSPPACTINGVLGCGTVFKITPSGALTTLYNFCPSLGNCIDGAVPYAGLIQATDGNFYGTTFIGGTGFLPSGTVFKITPSGGSVATLYSFCSAANCADGTFPYDRLVQRRRACAVCTDRNFYGTTSESGVYGGGTVFRLGP